MSRILIVEDEALIRAELRRLLIGAGYDVLEADSIAAVERDHDLSAVDLVLTDLRLPGAPSTELIARARPVPVIVMYCSRPPSPPSNCEYIPVTLPT